jgi:hypothetical protein
MNLVFLKKCHVDLLGEGIGNAEPYGCRLFTWRPGSCDVLNDVDAQTSARG